MLIDFLIVLFSDWCKYQDIGTATFDAVAKNTLAEIKSACNAAAGGGKLVFFLQPIFMGVPYSYLTRYLNFLTFGMKHHSPTTISACKGFIHVGGKYHQITSTAATYHYAAGQFVYFKEKCPTIKAITPVALSGGVFSSVMTAPMTVDTKVDCHIKIGTFTFKAL